MSTVQTNLRLPEEIHATLAAEARAERRSRNQQIVRILEERYREASADLNLANETATREANVADSVQR